MRTALIALAALSLSACQTTGVGARLFGSDAAMLETLDFIYSAAECDAQFDASNRMHMIAVMRGVHVVAAYRRGEITELEAMERLEPAIAILCDG